MVGNRPQFIKAAPTSVALRERGIDEVVLHTGQHYDARLSQVFFEELALGEPRYGLDLRTADTGEMRAAIAEPLARELREHFTDAELVELTFLIGYINMLNLFNNALGVRYHGEYAILAPAAR